MKKLLKSKVCGTREQCTSALFTGELVKSCGKKKKKKEENADVRSWIQTDTQCGFGSTFEFCICVFLLSLFFFFFFSAAHVSEETKFTVHVLFNTIHTMFRYCSRTVHGTYSHFIHKKNIKNRSHGTIHTFKNYFAIVFSIFSFQFQQK